MKLKWFYEIVLTVKTTVTVTCYQPFLKKSVTLTFKTGSTWSESTWVVTSLRIMFFFFFRFFDKNWSEIFPLRLCWHTLFLSHCSEVLKKPNTMQFAARRTPTAMLMTLTECKRKADLHTQCSRVCVCVCAWERQTIMTSLFPQEIMFPKPWFSTL